MKHFFRVLTLLCVMAVHAQKPCDFSINVVDSIGSYKTTKEYLLYEKNFGGNASYVFGSFILTDKNALFNLQLIEKSPNFIKVKCFDKNSKVYLQLINGRIVTLSLTNEESCGSLVRDEKGLNSRVLSGYFSLNKTDIDELKKSPISFVRIKFATELIDFVFRKEFKAELDGLIYQPESFFIDYLHCLEQKN